MPKDIAGVLKDALSLAPEARAALVGSLIESLDMELDENAEQNGERRSIADSRRLTAEPLRSFRGRKHTVASKSRLAG